MSSEREELIERLAVLNDSSNRNSSIDRKIEEVEDYLSSNQDDHELHHFLGVLYVDKVSFDEVKVEGSKTTRYLLSKASAVEGLSNLEKALNEFSKVEGDPFVSQAQEYSRRINLILGSVKFKKPISKRIKHLEDANCDKADLQLPTFYYKIVAGLVSKVNKGEANSRDINIMKFYLGRIKKHCIKNLNNKNLSQYFESQLRMLARATWLQYLSSDQKSIEPFLVGSDNRSEKGVTYKDEYYPANLYLARTLVKKHNGNIDKKELREHYLSQAIDVLEYTLYQTKKLLFTLSNKIWAIDDTRSRKDFLSKSQLYQLFSSGEVEEEPVNVEVEGGIEKLSSKKEKVTKNDGLEDRKTATYKLFERYDQDLEDLKGILNNLYNLELKYKDEHTLEKVHIHKKIVNNLDSEDFESNLFLARHYFEEISSSSEHLDKSLNHYKKAIDVAFSESRKVTNIVSDNGLMTSSGHKEKVTFEDVTSFLYLTYKIEEVISPSVDKILKIPGLKKDPILGTLYQLFKIKNAVDPGFDLSSSEARSKVFSYDPLEIENPGPLFKMVQREVKNLISEV